MIERWMKKPIIIEAVQFTGSNHDEIREFVGDENYARDFDFREIETLEGRMIARPGDYIIRGIRGEFYPCNKEIFHETYIPAPTQRE